MSLPILKYRAWAKILRNGNATYLGQDSQNHHVWSYTPAGGAVPVTAGITAHSDGDDVKDVYIKKLRKAWKLTKNDGVSDHNFMRSKWS